MRSGRWSGGASISSRPFWSGSSPEGLAAHRRKGTMKRLLIILLAVVVLAGLVAPAEGGHGRGRWGGHGGGHWEGLAIGLGAVSLYNLFSYGMFAPVVPPYTYGPPAAVYAPPVVYQQPAVVYQAPTVVCPPPA